MHPSPTESRLRIALLRLAAVICAGTIVELWLAEHTKSAVQLLPFLWCAIALATILVALLRPRRGTLRALQAIMAALVVGSLVGMWQHWSANLSFELDIRPQATLADVWLKTLHGAAPLLAPGVLALAATIALLATYGHPALHSSDPERSAMR